MKTLLVHPTRITSATLLGFLLSIAACGSPGVSLGEGSQAISGNQACALGVPQAEAQGCQIVAHGLCFASAEAACACDGCELEQCAIAESFPEQAICQNHEPSGSDPNEPVSSNPDEAVSNDGNGSNGSCGAGTDGGGSPANPGGNACAAGTERDSDARCDFVVAGLCFTSSASACACAGCAQNACIILESYPAQIACSTAH